jgi:hypothetical protein
MNKVNLFIIGAPKCGTTALCGYLSGHSDICFSEPKEAKYFHTDFNISHRYALTESEYHSCFKLGYGTAKVLAEGTVWYLYSTEAIKNILKYNKDAKFVVMIRNPVDLAYSLHSQLLYGGDESVSDFKKAWGLQKARKNKKLIPKGCRDAKSLQYGDVAKLGGQVQRLLKYVNRKNIVFVVFDDFIANPQQSYRKILEFTNLEFDGRESFEKINENRSLRTGPLPQIMYLAKFFKNKLGISKSIGIWKFLQPVISKKSKRDPITESFRSELNDYFRDDVVLLSKLVGRDLTEWLGQ